MRNPRQQLPGGIQTMPGQTTGEILDFFINSYFFNDILKVKNNKYCGPVSSENWV